MKIHIAITADNGDKYEGNVQLVRVSGKGKAAKPVVSTPSVPSSSGKLSFSLNSRAFMNKHAKGKSGSKKFTLLLAHAVGGKVGQEVAGKRLVADWNRMKGILGGTFNGAHATRAKDEGWIDSPRYGYYALASAWPDSASGT